MIWCLQNCDRNQWYRNKWWIIFTRNWY